MMNAKSLACTEDEHWQEDEAACQAVRTAAYIRVSTDAANQEDSYDTQRRYFENMLNEHQELVSAGIYSDYGLSGTDSKDRIGYQRLIRHCREGRIDRIVTKSISRFHRNTLEFLKAIAILDECHVSILFEREGIDTAIENNLMILVMLAASAQQESQSISTNLLWGNQKRLKHGEAVNRVIYGYRYAEGYEMLPSGYPIRKVEVMEEEAKVVRRIFEEVAAGSRYIDVARGLNREGIPAPKGRDRKKKEVRNQVSAAGWKERPDVGWTGQHIGRILRLERYCGDVLMGKTYAVDDLTHQRSRNDGQTDRAYVKNHHPAIISRELFERTQCVVNLNAAKYREGHGLNREKHPYSGRLVCSWCGRSFRYVAGNYAQVRWKCAAAAIRNGRHLCDAAPILEETLRALCRQAAMDRFASSYENEKKRRLAGRSSPSVFPDRDRMSIVQKMLAVLLAVHAADNAEHHICFLNEAIERHLSEAAHLRCRAEKARTEAALQKTQAEDLPGEAEQYDEEAHGHEAAAEQLRGQLMQTERYWKLLEADHSWRESAILWMQQLPGGKAGTRAFLEGLSGVYFRAFFLQVEVISPERCRFHWFDDVWTEVNSQDPEHD